MSSSAVSCRGGYAGGTRNDSGDIDTFVRSRVTECGADWYVVAIGQPGASTKRLRHWWSHLVAGEECVVLRLLLGSRLLDGSEMVVDVRRNRKALLGVEAEPKT